MSYYCCRMHVEKKRAAGKLQAGIKRAQRDREEGMYYCSNEMVL